jgi:hypothetical protein
MYGQSSPGQPGRQNAARLVTQFDVPAAAPPSNGAPFACACAIPALPRRGTGAVAMLARSIGGYSVRGLTVS